MPKIHVLPDILANKIAAGEVVERPSSVVKELLENSLDAGAKHIRVESEAGGKQLLRILDDGEGMTREDALLAFKRHATSKLRDIDELERISTLGFRGEALPSIASVSRVTLKTRTEAELEGTEVEIEGGQILKVSDLAWPGGTQLEIRDLFFNTPARRKFLKSDSTENFHISNLVTHYALANPHISFTLCSNGRETISTTPVESFRDRAYQLFGAEFVDNLVEIEDSGVVSVRGFISKPEEQRASRDSQYVFVNGRFVRDRVIARAISEAYKNVLPSGTYPSVMLMITVPSEEVDVNVHPAKTEVRFQRPYAVHEAVCNAIRTALTTSKPFASFPIEKIVATPTPIKDDSTNIVILNKPLPQAFETVRPPTLPEVDDPFDLARSSAPAVEIVQQGLNFTVPVSSEPEILNCSSLTIDYKVDDRLPGLNKIQALGQLRDSFIVAIDSQGLLLIDQHVAHERILFEKQLERIKTRALELQQYLIPETLELTPAQAAAFDLIEAEFAANGIHTMRLSGRTIAVQTAPSMLSASDAKRLILSLIAMAEKRTLSLEDFQREIAASLACHAAIKVNTPLSREKMEWLIEALMATECPTNCPHGRPIILRFTMRDIERGFKRT